MYEYFGVGPKLHNSKAQVFPRFFRWSSRNRISGGKKRTLQDWRLIIESLTETNVSFFFWPSFRYFFLFWFALFFFFFFFLGMN